MSAVSGTVSVRSAPLVEIAYERHGDPGGVPLLLVHGVGRTLAAWHPGLLAALGRHGYDVLICDNRDIGRSTHLSALGVPDPAALRAGPSLAPYRLDDLADDMAGLLEALRWPSAHVLGVSMGGMVAQLLALRHPQRVRSLTSVMSTTGDPAVSRPTREALAVLRGRQEAGRDAYIEQRVRDARITGSTGFPAEEAWLRASAGAGWDRGHDPDGAARQLAAILVGTDRSAELADLDLPTLVVHGDADPLVPVAAGRATAAAVPAADLLEIEGMGHDLPQACWERVLDRLDDVTRRGEARRPRDRRRTDR